MPEYGLFWGETHHNTYQRAEGKPQDPPLADVVSDAMKHLDFYAAAYYTPVASPPTILPRFAEGGRFRGAKFEGWKPTERLEQEWAEVQEVTRQLYQPGRFVTFPGYEWQGDGTCGDYNVYHFSEGQPIARVDTVRELYAFLRPRNAIAIPHHTGYRPGIRAPQWSACDETLSPFVELYSLHGCSETDEETIGLRRNSHMGPGMAGGTYRDALRAGLHLGAIASTDNGSDDLPGQYGGGLTACLAGSLTREALWEAFRARRVYAVTGDRIELDFTVNGHPMGGIVDGEGRRSIRVRVRGADAIDRIELLRNERLLATYCHQGQWSLPPSGARSRFKLRIEAGWGPRPGELPLEQLDWHGELQVPDGRWTSWQPCWLNLGQTAPRLDGGQARFGFHQKQTDVTGPCQNAVVLELEGTPEAQLLMQLNGLQMQASVSELCSGSRILYDRDEAIRRVERMTGIRRAEAEREDTFYHMARKVKVHRALPEAAYTADWRIEDDEPLVGETCYRIRVEQRNGQRAWSSPIWVRPR